MAAIGIAIADSPLTSPILAPSLGGATPLLRIPDPAAISRSLQPDATAPFRDWKNIRGPDRRAAALGRLLAACRAGQCVFLSHSTLSQFADGIASRFLAEYCRGFVVKDGLIGLPEYSVDCAPFGSVVRLSRQRLVSLIWVVHCLRVFLQKSREALGNVDAVFVHDNLPFNRPTELIAVRAFLNALDPGRVHFITDRSQFSFAPADNLAAATNDFITGKDATIQQWVWAGGRPGNFYMTADEDDGKFTRFI